MKNYVIIVSGPTASGKSELSLKIAEKIGGEIINADIGSLYTPLTIGTAKPDWRRSKITHHLFDILDHPVNFTIVEFRESVQKLTQEIWGRGNVPIVVGGSAFYIKALFYRQHEIPQASEFIANLEQQVTQGFETSLQLWEKLHQIDAVRAKKIHPHDSYRIIRALAIFQITGKNPSEFEPIFDPIASFFFIECKRERNELYERINQRVHEMIKFGWLNEVKKLQSTPWQNFLIRKKLIGYDDLLKYLDNQNSVSLDQLIPLIQQKTRNYAKRQIIFLNKLEREIKIQLQQHQFSGSVQDINLTYCDVGLYIKGLSNQILQTLS